MNTAPREVLGQNSRGRVLVVDDEPNPRASYGRILIDAGFEVATASDSKEALKDVERKPFDLVLIDLSISDLDRFAFLRRVRDQADLPILVMLDAIDNSAWVQATESGLVQMLLKPIDPGLLQKAVASAIRVHSFGHRSSPALSFRSPAQVISVSATEGKNEFASILEKAIRGQHVVINKHETPKAVLISVEEFSALTREGQFAIDSLSAEFDALMATMQLPNAKRAMKAAFNASPKQMGEAALALAAKRHRSS